MEGPEAFTAQASVKRTCNSSPPKTVSYTHLDVYKRQLLGMLYSRLIESVSMQGWKIDAADDSPEAQQQKNALEELYHSVTGLQQSFGNLASALFYGYASCV